MVKALTFKGDKKVKKRKRQTTDGDEDDTTANKQLALHNDAPPEDDDNWVSASAVTDLAGPVMLVLPSEPASCMAVDQLGTVFTSRIENMIENEPSSAEPHDVRQVWVLQKIVGMENSFTFKGHHGR
jgi:protein FRG1